MARPAYTQKTTRKAYVVSFKIFYNTVSGCCTAIKKRKRQWLANPIMSKMEHIKQIVFYLADGKIEGQEAEYIITKKIDEVFIYLKRLETPFCSLWSHKNFTDTKMQKWIDQMMDFARDLNLRYPDYKDRPPITEEIFSIPDLNKHDKAIFVDRMYKIHNQAISYVANTSGKYTDPTQFSVVNLANEALSEVVNANKIWAHGLENLRKRRAKLIRGLNLVKTLGTSVVNHGHFHGYSQATITKWCKSINEEVKLLNGEIDREKKLIESLEKEANKDVKQ